MNFLTGITEVAHNLPRIVDPKGLGVDSAGDIEGREAPPTQEKAMTDARSIRFSEEADYLSQIIDPKGVGGGGAGDRRQPAEAPPLEQKVAGVGVEHDLAAIVDATGIR